MQKHNTVTISVNSLPVGLQQLHKPPASLYCKGNTDLLSSDYRVAIVGARKLTPYGREVTSNIAASLAKQGIVVVSGLAMGVDSIAHRACVEAGGATIAVLPSGIEQIYPASHTQLARNIVDCGGLLVSEYPDKQLPMKHQFIERNRIIAALSHIVVITEAAVASGSLHTARFALEQGITVMAAPGNITSPYSAGTNLLIQTGAAPLLSPDNVLHELGIDKQEPQTAYLPENEVEQAILAAIVKGNSQTSHILNTCDHEAHIIQTHLTMLEIKGVIAAQSGNWSIKA